MMEKVSYEGLDQAFELDKKAQDLFSICRQMKFPIPFSCRVGTCGICKIEVLEGEENLSRKTKEEKEFTTSPTERLACQAKAKGSVKIVRSRS